MIRVLIVDDHAAFRQPLAFMLEREPEISVGAQAGSLAEARNRLTGIDVAILDLDLPDGSGMTLIQPIRAANPRSAVLVLTGSGDAEEIARAVDLGASGVMHKTARIQEIVEGVQRLALGETILSRQEAAGLLEAAGQQRTENREAQEKLAELTPRERDVLAALAQGLSDREIADQLHVGHETVRTHMAKILSKLEVESRLQALVFATRHGAVKVR